MSETTSLRVLVTGSSGFIGGCLIDRLVELGCECVGVGRRSVAAEHYDYVQHDLSQPLDRDEFAGPWDVVIHAAAKASPWGSAAEFHRDNVEATDRVIEFCQSHGLPKLVFLSSSSVYYEPRHQLDIDETTSPAARPVNRYAATKQLAEQRVRAYSGRWVILRPRAVFGPRDTVLLPRILRAAREGKLPLLVARSPVVGDLIYIDNLVDYIVAAATNGAIVGEYNLTNNEPVAINEFLLDVFRRLDIPPPRRRLSVGLAMWAAGGMELFYGLCMPRREPPITRFGVHVFAYSKTFNVAKMIADMGPPRIPLADGVERLVEWTRSASAAVDDS